MRMGQYHCVRHGMCCLHYMSYSIIIPIQWTVMLFTTHSCSFPSIMMALMECCLRFTVLHVPTVDCSKQLGTVEIEIKIELKLKTEN